MERLRHWGLEWDVLHSSPWLNAFRKNPWSTLQELLKVHKTLFFLCIITLYIAWWTWRLDVDRLVQCRNFCPFDFVTVSRTSFKDRAQRVHRNVLLILGCCNAGKTQLFYRLQGKEFHNVTTVSSLKPNVFKFTKTSLSAASPLRDIEFPKSISLTELVDFPGHARLFPELKRWLPRAFCILFLIDATDKRAIKSSAEQLYDLFLFPDLSEHQIPIVIVCNKTDLSIAKTKAGVQADLLREIERLRVSRSAVLEAGDEVDQFLGVEGKLFTFDDAPLPVFICTAPSSGAYPLEDVTATLSDAFN